MVHQDFYTTLNKLKRDNKALWNGGEGGEMSDINAPGHDNLFAFLRQKGKNKVVVIINFSDEDGIFLANSMAAFGTYKNVFTMDTLRINEYSQFNLKPWSYLVLTN